MSLWRYLLIWCFIRRINLPLSSPFTISLTLWVNFEARAYYLFLIKRLFIKKLSLLYIYIFCFFFVLFFFFFWFPRYFLKAFNQKLFTFRVRWAHEGVKRWPYYIESTNLLLHKYSKSRSSIPLFLLHYMLHK